MPATATPPALPTRILAFAYGAVSYAIFFATFLYAIGFLGNFLVPKSIDSAPVGSLGEAVLVNVLLLAVFAVQHSGMARPSFKRWWTRYVPWPIERATYVLISSLLMIVLFWQWRPMGGVVWEVDAPVARGAIVAVYFAGWGVILLSTFLLNHFDLFGLRQVWLFLHGRPYTFLPFRVPGLYRIVRHPLYVGWLMTIWAAPTMTAAHLLFAVVTTTYILVAIRLEERNLVEDLREYARYRQSVPMLLPFTKGLSRGPFAGSAGGGTESGSPVRRPT